MKRRLFRIGIVAALTLQPLQSRAHESVLAHSHEMYVSASLIGVSIVSMLLLLAKRGLK
ncbi:MAG: hypothetical protein ACI9UN_002112 [Granulosicoccus sp.]|jgi:hypothetical protein